MQMHPNMSIFSYDIYRDRYLPYTFFQKGLLTDLLTQTNSLLYEVYGLIR